MSFDLENRKLILPDGYSIESQGSLNIKARDHLILSSGCDEEPTRPGHYHSIWLNTELDSEGRPLLADEAKILDADVEEELGCSHDK